MKRMIQSAVLAVSLLTGVTVANAATGKYADTITIFRNAGESGDFFAHSYGYAVFPNVGEGALGVGAALGKGRGLCSRPFGRRHHHETGQRWLPSRRQGIQPNYLLQG